jgi:hypothetical protein
MVTTYYIHVSNIFAILVLLFLVVVILSIKAIFAIIVFSYDATYAALFGHTIKSFEDRDNYQIHVNLEQYNWFYMTLSYSADYTKRNAINGIHYK